MHKYLMIFVAFAAVLSGPAVAASDSCFAHAMTQASMNVCASQEAGSADRQLYSVYRQLVAAAVKNPAALQQIKAEESAWASYRDAYIAATYPAADKQKEYGSSYPMKADLLRAQLTQRHIADLQQMLKRYRGQ